MNEELAACLAQVQKPARYTGGEYNQVVKQKDKVNVRFALSFPEVYEIAMSHLGSKILYGLLNKMDGVWCERVYAPFPDMEAQMRLRGLPVYALESGDALGCFDMIGFSLQYELNYSTVLNMLDMAGIPLYASERGRKWPLVIAGGPCVYNLEPMADFFDLIVVGEGEEVLPELIALYRKSREANESRTDFLEKAAQIDGIYVPSFYKVEYKEDGTVFLVTPSHGAPAVVKKRVVADFDKAYYPDYFIVPSTEIVFDRAMVELFRGCRRGCRFCQAGYTYRPIRAKEPETLAEQARKLVASTGYDEVSLTSLSSSDYPDLAPLCDVLTEEFEPRHVSLALPSLRADSFDLRLMENVQKVRRSGLTFAPEAGSQRLRDVINKNLREEDLLEACKTAFAAGWNSVKLYFMLGLPSETDEDLFGIGQIVEHVLDTFRKYAKNKSHGVRISVGVATFVPKAQTPFQWLGQAGKEEVLHKQLLLRDILRKKNITLSLHKYNSSFLEAVLARGDRRLSAVIEEAWRRGCSFDGWDEYFHFERWMEAFSECGLDPAFYANRTLTEDEMLPWDHVFSGVNKKYLWGEYLNACEGQATPDCKAGCLGCGASNLTGGKCYV